MQNKIIVFVVILCTSFSSTFAQNSVSNDDPNAAVELIPSYKSVGYDFFGQTVNATHTIVDTPSCFANGAGADVWYKFKANNPTLTINVQGINKNTEMGIALYIGDSAPIMPTNNLFDLLVYGYYNVISNPRPKFDLIQVPDACGSSKLELTKLNIGTNYLIRVFTVDTTIEDYFKISIINPSSIVDDEPSDINSFLNRTNHQANIVSISAVDGNFKVQYYDRRSVLRRVNLASNNNRAYINSKLVWWPQVSLVTIPIKVRGATHGKRQDVNTDIKNIGAFIGPYKKWDVYHPTGSVTTHKVAVGIFLGPSGEEYNADNTIVVDTVKSTQLVLSTAGAVTYSYNDLSFAFAVGWDFPLTKDGKNWIYKRQPWWGIGLGIDTKLFGF